jgi:hypothetical protein
MREDLTMDLVLMQRSRNTECDFTILSINITREFFTHLEIESSV